MGPTPFQMVYVSNKRLKGLQAKGGNKWVVQYYAIAMHHLMNNGEWGVAAGGRSKFQAGMG